MQAERMSWGMDDALKIIHVDIDPTEINRIMKPDVGLVSDAAFTTRKIIDALNKYNLKRTSREEEMLNLKAQAEANGGKSGAANGMASSHPGCFTGQWFIRR